MKRKAVTLQLEGEIPQPQSAYDAAVEDGYEGSEEQYGKELAAITPTQDQFDAIPGRISKLTTTTEKSDFHHITDSAADKVVDFGMEGKTEQETTSGKNLWNAEYAKNRNNWDDTIIAGGYTTIAIYVGTGKRVCMHLKNSLDAGLSFLLAFSAAPPAVFDLIYNNTSANVKNVKTQTDYVYICVNVNGFDNFITYANDILQVEISDTPTDYEPYTNGPSPNPDYPQEIVNAGVYNEATGRYEIGCKVFARNKFDKNNVSDGMINGDGTVTPTTSIKVTDFIKVNGGIKYYCSATGSGRFYYFGKNKQPVEGSVNASNGALFTTPTDAEYVRFCVDKEYVDTVILCESPVTIPYEPYTEQPFTLTSPVPLTKWDYLTKRDGVWGWRTFGIINDDFIFTSQGTDETVNGRIRHRFQTNQRSVYSGVISEKGLCTHMKFVTSTNTANVQLAMLASGYFYVYFYEETGIDTVDKANQWLAKKRANGEIIELVYNSDTEQSFHPLPDEEQTLLHNLETYYGVTNLYNDQGCPMWLTYVQDTKAAIDNKFNNIRQAVLSLGGNV